MFVCRLRNGKVMDFANRCTTVEFLEEIKSIGFVKKLKNGRELLLAIVPVDQIEYVVNILNKDIQ